MPISGECGMWREIQNVFSVNFTMKVFNLEEGAVIRPLPKIKLALSDPSHFPHLVQLLLPLTPHWSSE